jgi:foldase protein PrsA
MPRPFRLLLPIALVAALSLGLIACGGDDNEIPGNAVAKVGDGSITKDEYDHWVDVTLAQAGANGPKIVLGTPPDFATCVAQKKKDAPDPAKGTPPTPDSQYLQECKTQYEAVRDQVMGFLISAEWLQQEADQRDISVTDAELQKQLEDTKKQSFPKEKDYQDFLKSSGMTEEDVLYRVELDALTNKIREAVTKGKDKVTDQQITDYYNKNKARFSTPETRDVRIVLTRDEAKANEAKQALESGQSWKDVAKQYSIDEASKTNGGLLAGVSEGQQEQALDKAIFASDKGQLSGPVKTQFGWYVFEVDKITPAQQQTQAESTEAIKQLLASEGQQKALDTFVKDFEKRWKAETECRDGYRVQTCSNAEKPKTAATAAATPTTTP